MSLIVVNKLTKTFKVSQKNAGIRGALSDLFCSVKKEVCVVDNVDLAISSGQIVGFLGPNGAGKSTTIKMLCGILHPTAGHVEINGLSPYQNRRAVVQNIGVVFGQRTQLYWDLRLGESFELLRRVYRIENKVYQQNVGWMKEEFGLAELMDVPVRQLSLGQRMRGEVSAALLHSPKILFLDEPTIGLDIEAKKALRGLVKKVNEEKKTTVILTTHDLEDVEHLCRRLIVINHGKIVEDGPIEQLMDKLVPFRILEVDVNGLVGEDLELSFSNGDIIERGDSSLKIRFDQNLTTAAGMIREVLDRVDVKDLRVREPEVEEMVLSIYNRDDSAMA